MPDKLKFKSLRFDAHRFPEAMRDSGGQLNNKEPPKPNAISMVMGCKCWWNDIWDLTSTKKDLCADSKLGGLDGTSAPGK